MASEAESRFGLCYIDSNIKASETPSNLRRSIHASTFGNIRGYNRSPEISGYPLKSLVSTPPEPPPNLGRAI